MLEAVFPHVEHEGRKSVTSILQNDLMILANQQSCKVLRCTNQAP